MMKSAMIGAVAGFLAFVSAWVGWAYVTGKLDGANAVAARAAKPQDAQVALPAAATSIGSSKVRRDDDGSPVAVAHRGEPLEVRSAPAVPPPSVPATAAPAPAVAASAVVPVTVPLLPDSPAVPPAAPIAPAALQATTEAECIAQPPVLAHVEVAAVAPAVPVAEARASKEVPPAASAVHTVEPAVVAPPPTRSEAEVARAEQTIAKFAAAQEALRNFRLQMPAKQAPATVAAAAGPSAAVVVPEARPVPADPVPAAEAAPVRAPALATAAATSPIARMSSQAASPSAPAVRPATRRRAPAAPAATAAPAPVVTASVASAPIPLVSFPGKNPGDAAGLAELDLLSRATDAMKRLSKKLGSPRIR